MLFCKVQLSKASNTQKLICLCNLNLAFLCVGLGLNLHIHDCNTTLYSAQEDESS